MLVLAAISIVVEEAVELAAKALWCIIPLQLMMPRAQAKAKDAPTMLLELLFPPSFFPVGNENPSSVQVIGLGMCWTVRPTEPLGNERDEGGKPKWVLVSLAAFTGWWMRSAILAMGQGRVRSTENSMGLSDTFEDIEFIPLTLAGMRMLVPADFILNN